MVRLNHSLLIGSFHRILHHCQKCLSGYDQSLSWSTVIPLARREYTLRQSQHHTRYGSKATPSRWSSMTQGWSMGPAIKWGAICLPTISHYGDLSFKKSDKAALIHMDVFTSKFL